MIFTYIHIQKNVLLILNITAICVRFVGIWQCNFILQTFSILFLYLREFSYGLQNCCCSSFLPVYVLIGYLYDESPSVHLNCDTIIIMAKREQFFLFCASLLNYRMNIILSNAFLFIKSPVGGSRTFSIIIV